MVACATLAFSAALTLVASSAQALVYSIPVKVTKVFACGGYSGGDIAFQTSTPVSGCEGGGRLRHSDPGFAALSASPMTGYAAGLGATVAAHADKLWSGSYLNYSRVDALA